jgi:hypothetical protein
VTTPQPHRGASPQAPTPRLSAPLLVLVAVLLAAPLVGLLWVSSYAKADPELFGFPFFYWYQFAWVLIAAATTSIAYRIVVRHERRRRALTHPASTDDEAGR